MKQKKRVFNFIPNFLLGLAIIGLLILYLGYGGRRLNRSTSTDISLLYPFFAGLSLILPYLILLIIRPKLLKNNKTRNKNAFKIFVFNDSKENLIINRNSKLEDNQQCVFKLSKDESLIFSNGIIINIDVNNNLETKDSKNQIIGLGEDYYTKYNVPNSVDWAFIISKPNNGDTTK